MPNETFDAFGNRITPTTVRRTVRSSFTRPSDTTIYTIGDVVGPVTTAAAQAFPGVARVNGGSGRILRFTLETNNATVTLGTFRVHVFNTAVVPQADNAPYTGLHAGIGSYVGFCDPPIVVADYAGASGVISRLTSDIDATKGLPMDYVCAAGDSGLYVVLIALGAYVPASAQVFNLAMTVSLD